MMSGIIIVDDVEPGAGPSTTSTDGDLPLEIDLSGETEDDGPVETSAGVRNTPINNRVRAACWSFFTICRENKALAQCTKCKKTFSRGKTGHFGTSNLKRHLQKEHNAAYGVAG